MEKIIVRDEPNSSIAELYRSLRDQLFYSNVDNNIKKIMITSSNKSEGKSTISVNLAFAISETKRVIILDCDFRRPTIHRKFGVSNLEGITDILLKKEDYARYIKKIDNVDVLTTGQLPKNPSEILSSASLKQLINQISCDYDYVILDCTPVIILDPFIMLPYVDGVIYIIRSGLYEINEIKKHIQKLKAKNANIIGIVLNYVDAKKHRYDYYKQNKNYKN